MNCLIIFFVHLYFVFWYFVFLVDMLNFFVSSEYESVFHVAITLFHLSPLLTMSLLNLVIFYFDIVKYINFSTYGLVFEYLV